MDKTEVAEKPYGPSWYQVPPAVMAELRTLEPHRPVLAALANWAWIFLIVKLYLAFGRWWLYPAAVLLIAGRAGVFLQLAHEAGHGLISKGRFNDWFGNWGACYPIGLDLPGYKEPHMWHHACVNQLCDPLSDREKYRVTDIRNPKLWLLFLKDLTGITALTIRFQYARPASNEQQEPDFSTLEEGAASFQAVVAGGGLRANLKFLGIAAAQAAILGLLFELNVFHYAALWLVPLVTAHMFLMRVRGIAEHGLGIQLGVPELSKKNRGTFFTRSFGTPLNAYGFTPAVWLERFIIGSLDVYYHHEHHLYPKVPYYNLPKVHALVAGQVAKNNPFVYVKGYFDCLFFNLREHGPAPTL